jgi:hypothetical protein
MAVSDTLYMLGRHTKDGKRVPGAKIVGEYDLVDRGLAWQKGIMERPDFVALEHELRGLFRTL